MKEGAPRPESKSELKPFKNEAVFDQWLAGELRKFKEEKKKPTVAKLLSAAQEQGHAVDRTKVKSKFTEYEKNIAKKEKGKEKGKMKIKAKPKPKKAPEPANGGGAAGEATMAGSLRPEDFPEPEPEAEKEPELEKSEEEELGEVSTEGEEKAKETDEESVEEIISRLEKELEEESDKVEAKEEELAGDIPAITKRKPMETLETFSKEGFEDVERERVRQAAKSWYGEDATVAEIKRELDPNTGKTQILIRGEGGGLTDTGERISPFLKSISEAEWKEMLRGKLEKPKVKKKEAPAKKPAKPKEAAPAPSYTEPEGDSIIASADFGVVEANTKAGAAGQEATLGRQVPREYYEGPEAPKFTRAEETPEERAEEVEKEGENEPEEAERESTIDVDEALNDGEFLKFLSSCPGSEELVAKSESPANRARIEDYYEAFKEKDQLVEDFSKLMSENLRATVGQDFEQESVKKALQVAIEKRAREYPQDIAKFTDIMALYRNAEANKAHLTGEIERIMETPHTREQIERLVPALLERRNKLLHGESNLKFWTGLGRVAYILDWREAKARQALSKEGLRLDHKTISYELKKADKQLDLLRQAHSSASDFEAAKANLERIKEIMVSAMASQEYYSQVVKSVIGNKFKSLLSGKGGEAEVKAKQAVDLVARLDEIAGLKVGEAEREDMLEKAISSVVDRASISTDVFKKFEDGLSPILKRERVGKMSKEKFREWLKARLEKISKKTKSKEKKIIIARIIAKHCS